MSIPKPVILDISEHQLPSDINYDKLAGAIDGVIIRIQYGSRYLDKHYKTHITAFQKRGIPVAVYAWIRGTSKADMEQEATDFYNRSKAYNPVMWWLDVEEQSMGDMRGGTEAYRAKLKSLGAKKIGVYVANHLYSQFNLDMSKFDGIWIPTYGTNNGQYNGSNPTATSNYNLHQYTSNGRLAGYNGPLDLSRIAKGSFSDFFGTTTPSKPTPPSTSKLPSLESLATDTAKGKYGNGDQRKKNLGHLYPGVQAIINHRAKPNDTQTAINILATETKKGVYGNGADRKARLGNYYQLVQDKINKG